VQFGAESEIAWCATIVTLPRVQTEDDLGPELLACFEIHQHPDRDD